MILQQTASCSISYQAFLTAVEEIVLKPLHHLYDPEILGPTVASTLPTCMLLGNLTKSLLVVTLGSKVVRSPLTV